MADPTSPNIGLAQPTRGSDVGTWDTPVNNNMGILDTMLGGVTSITLNNANIILSAPQFQTKFITFSSTLTGSVTITFPTSFIASYEIRNICTGSSAFTITLATTSAGGQHVACPPYDIFEIVNDGSNIFFKNFGRIGTYWDYAGSSVPNWVSACSVPPYLNCDGTVFNGASYPALAAILGGTTLPDARGRSRFALNQGTGRITASGGFGIDGNTALSGGGSETLAQQSLPNVNFAVSGITLTNGAGTLNGNAATNTNGATTGIAVGGVTLPSASFNTLIGNFSLGTNVSVATQGNAASGGSGSPLLPPGYVGGLTLIRAA